MQNCFLYPCEGTLDRFIFLICVDLDLYFRLCLVSVSWYPIELCPCHAYYSIRIYLIEIWTPEGNAIWTFCLSVNSWLYLHWSTFIWQSDIFLNIVFHLFCVSKNVLLDWDLFLTKSFDITVWISSYSEFLCL